MSSFYRPGRIANVRDVPYLWWGTLAKGSGHREWNFVLVLAAIAFIIWMIWYGVSREGLVGAVPGLVIGAIGLFVYKDMRD